MDLATGSIRSTYESFLARWKRIAAVREAMSLLGWDQMVMMPPKGAAGRAQQLTALKAHEYELLTAPELVREIEALEAARWAGAFHSHEAANIRVAHREVTRSRKIPLALATEIARLESVGFESWRAAREANDFAAFAPAFGQLVARKRELADALAPHSDRYAPLLHEYEPDFTIAEVRSLLATLRKELVPLAQRIIGLPHHPDDSLLVRGYAHEPILAFGRRVITAMGYDFEAGRLDLAPHPFCSGGIGDVRITTRHIPGKEEVEGIFSIMHEAGHALYEQGLPDSAAWTPMRIAASTGIHESQSRFWEVYIGRSREFWNCQFPELRRAFPEILGGTSVEEFYRAVNRVRASTIRVQSDALTYNLHIMIRVEVEEALMAGDLEAIDVPTAWNAKFNEFFGFEPPTDTEGALQDVHFGSGIFGYFPTYTIGNLFAAQLYETAEREGAGLREAAAEGDLRHIREWLRERVHQQGSLYPAPQLVRRATGASLGVDPFMRFLKARYGDVYGVAL